MAKAKWFGCLAVALTFSLSGYAMADAGYPTRPITLIQIYGPGSTSDMVTKALVEALKKELPVPITTVYATGRTGLVGAQKIANEKPDGYTIGVLSGGLASATHTTPVKFDPNKDFDFFGTYMQFLVGWAVKADSPYKSVKDLVDYARQHPNTLRFGNGNPGGFLGMGAAFVEKKDNVLFKNVPFSSGTAEAMTALLGGHVDFIAANPPLMLRYVKSGHIRMIVSASNVRHTDPNAPTLRELGYDFDQASWASLGGPKGIPADAKKRLEQALERAVKDPVFIETMKKMDTPINHVGGDEVGKMVTRYYDAWGPILKDNYRY